MLLEIAKIKATPEAQPRVSLHYPTVEEYAEALRGDAEFPPLIVFFDGTDHWLADGFHRLEAYKQCGYVEVPVDFRKGSKRDAILFSVGANARHGLPRTNEDKRRAVMVLLNDPEWGKKSDRWIAEQAAVSAMMVSRMRKDTSTNCNNVTVGQRECRDGKTRKLPERRAEESAPAEVRPEPEERGREGGTETEAMDGERETAPLPAESSQQQRVRRVDGVAVPAGDDAALYDRSGYSRSESRQIDENIIGGLDVAVSAMSEADWERLMRRVDMKRLERMAD